MFEIEGELDFTNAEDVGRRLVQFCEQVDGDNVEVDCSRVTYMDSYAMRMLVRVQRDTGKQLVLRALSPNCRQALEIASLERILQVRD